MAPPSLRTGLRLGSSILLGLSALVGVGGLCLLVALAGTLRPGPEIAPLGGLVLLAWLVVFLGTILGVLTSSLQRLSVLAWINLALVWLYWGSMFFRFSRSERPLAFVVMGLHAALLLGVVPFRKTWVPALGRSVRGLVFDAEGRRLPANVVRTNLGLLVLEGLAWSSLLALVYRMGLEDYSLGALFYHFAVVPVVILVPGQVLSLLVLLLRQRRWKAPTLAPGAIRTAGLAGFYGLLLLVAALTSR